MKNTRVIRVYGRYAEQLEKEKQMLEQELKRPLSTIEATRILVEGEKKKKEKKGPGRKPRKRDPLSWLDV